ncbi:hypothetical protein EPIB2_833 [Tritonibacter mobilis]|nr:hypothetical protein EPIB2_833 [Tritonibacter mobilis]
MRGPPTSLLHLVILLHIYQCSSNKISQPFCACSIPPHLRSWPHTKPEIVTGERKNKGAPEDAPKSAYI